MGLFGKKKKDLTPTKPIPVKWQGNTEGKYYRLMHIMPDRIGIMGMAGVYLVWHKGVKPGWVHAGATNNLGDTIEQLKDYPEIADFEGSGGVYVTWAPFKKEYWSGVVAYLNQVLKPKVPECSLDSKIREGAKPLPVTVPVKL